MENNTAKYIDGFVFPIHRIHLNQYRKVAEEVSEIWKEYGAIAYNEYIGDDLNMEGTRSFLEILNTKNNEVVIFGWVVFDSRETRDLANDKVATDPRMVELIAPLTIPTKIIFDANRMFYGGFKSIIQFN